MHASLDWRHEVKGQINERDGDLFFSQKIEPAASIQEFVPERLDCFNSEIGDPASKRDSKQVAVTKKILRGKRKASCAILRLLLQEY
jgi:hypothetical protein